jgi:MFS family permease
MEKKVVICLCIITMLSNASFSLIAPFYPLEV